METFSELFTARLSKLQNKLESFLEEDSLSSEEAKNIQQHFELQKSAAFFKGFSDGLPTDEVDKMAVLFSKLMHIFEFGVLLTEDHKNIKAVALFDHGVLKNLKEDSFLKVDLGQLPFAKFVNPKSKIFQNKIRSYFTQFRPHDELLLIKLAPHTLVAVGTRMAKPWLAPHLENTQNALLKALGL